MQKWEYKLIFRHRTIKETDESQEPLWRGAEWETEVDGKFQMLDFDKFLDELGDQGWELVSTLAESSLAGGISSIAGFVAFGGGKTQGECRDWAGFTNTEKWIFKRLKS